MAEGNLQKFTVEKKWGEIIPFELMGWLETSMALVEDKYIFEGPDWAISALQKLVRNMEEVRGFKFHNMEEVPGLKFQS